MEIQLSKGKPWDPIMKNNPTSKKENVMIFVSPEAKQDLIAR
jgi:hypothetical protein